MELPTVSVCWLRSTGERWRVMNSVFEALRCRQRSFRKSSFACIYLPPIHRQDEQTWFLQILHLALQRLLNDTSATVRVIAGDFNAHCSDWCASDHDDEIDKKMNNTFLSYSLEQLVTFPTHLNSTGYGASLDLVVINKPHRFQKLYSLDSLGDSDHVVISWELSTTFTALH